MKFLPRVFQYAEETRIRIKTVPRFAGWKKFGLPDIRGFTPHLRTVNTCKGENPSGLSKKGEEFWLVHDLLHIIFYDFASMNLGQESWNDKDRFIESHLASEAFAVLALDYHFLIKTDLKGLAVDVSSRDFSGFRSIYPELPAFDSFGFCSILTDFYLSGEGSLRDMAQRPSYKKTVHQANRKKFENWIGHEIRYADKQRFYVLAWLEDLFRLRPSKKRVAIRGSAIGAPLWELIGLLHWAKDSEWKSYLQNAKRFGVQTSNYFSMLPKYKRQNSRLDFRFTDITSLSQTAVKACIENVKGPRASDLFLLWQLISMLKPSEASDQERHSIQRLAQTAHTNQVDATAWKVAKELAHSALDKTWEPDPLGLATFFLP